MKTVISEAILFPDFESLWQGYSTSLNKGSDTKDENSLGPAKFNLYNTSSLMRMQRV